MFNKPQAKHFGKLGNADFQSGSKLRIIQALNFRKLNDSESNYSSVASLSLNSSRKTLGQSRIGESRFSLISSMRNSQISGVKKKQEAIKITLQKNHDRPFIKSLVQFVNKNWSEQQEQLLAEKKIQGYLNLVVQKSNWLTQLAEDFLGTEWDNLQVAERKQLASTLFGQCGKSVKELEAAIVDIVKRIPEEKALQQQNILQQLWNKVLDIYDPKYAYSSAKMKERFSLYYEQYVLKRNDIKADICTKLRSSLHYLLESERYFGAYQKQIIKLKGQVTSLETQKTSLQALISRKVSFTPIEVDYDRIRLLKQKAAQQIKTDLQQNIIRFHEQKHRKNEKKIAAMEQKEALTRQQLQQKAQEALKFQERLQKIAADIPQKKEWGTQAFLIQGRGQERIGGRGSEKAEFLQNVVSPFSFSAGITGSLISILATDKLLWDYEVVRQRGKMRSFQEFIFQWFIIRTGCKKISQIFIKNFFYSLKQLRGKHKRFTIFYRFSGGQGIRKKNMQEDLESLFFRTSLCWYYITKLALMYRAKLNQNPTGYQLLPPLDCEDIFKIPLRKTYQLIEQFFTSEEVQIPKDLSQKIDHYAINQINKFKSGDQNFQKESLQEIHILREINFDLIAGFVLQYMAQLRCAPLEKLFRTIHANQQQDGSPLAYSDFQAIYRKFYRQKRSKIELIYAKLCLVDQNDMLNIENMAPVVLIILEDEGPLRSSFERVPQLHNLILPEKILQRGEKRISPNVYQLFRERYYHQFYDFYSTTAFLQEIFKIVRALIRKQLRKTGIPSTEIQTILELPSPETKPQIENQERDSDPDAQSDQQSRAKSPKQKKKSEIDKQQKKEVLVGRLEQWGKIMARIPHFSSKILTIDQVVIHNMRRKEMIEACEFAYRTLREILSVLGKN